MSKLQLIGFFVLLVLILFNCTFSNEKANDFKKYDLTIPIEKTAIESIDWRVHAQRGINFITYIDTASTLFLFDIFQDRVLDSVKLQMDHIDIDYKYYPRRICYHNKDSIFILPDNGHRSIFLIGSDGEVRQEWNIDLILEYPYLLSAYSSNPMYFEKGKLLIRFIPNMSPYANRKVFFEIPPDLVFDIQKDSIYRVGAWPKKYSTQNFNDFAPQRMILPDKGDMKILYSYNADHNLYVLNDQKIIQEVRAKSDYIDNFKLYSDDSLNNIAYKMRYLITAPVYTKIFYDSSRKEYYRVALHRTSYIDEKTNNKKQGFDRPWSVIVFDSTFSKINEVKFSPEEYRAGPLLMSSEGLLIPQTSENNDFYSYSYTNFNSLR